MADVFDKKTIACLKKIVVSGGGEVGFFYFAGLPNLSQVALRVSLKSKDPKGQAVFNAGKLARKELGNAKFSRGEVLAPNKKVRFVHLAGTASMNLLQKAIKSEFSKEKGFGFLSKAKVVLPEQKMEDDGEVEDI